MAKIETTRFGRVKYNEEDIIHFENGIPGFEKEQLFLLIQPDVDQPYAFLQSIQTSDLAFVIVNPFIFYPNYEFDLDEQSKEELEINHVEDITVWGILSIPEDFKKTTINLKAPVIINVKNRKGKQVILHDTLYEIKTPLFSQKLIEGVK
ncbi:flagellar assembly protein FliW [Tepidibacillus fermentans]|uniref:Flagellar assembly factor FliW n=1 Tax=Tepidibacillus fermentans TaxID=1281767 RepID=A0A4R3KIF5_9BACI|nr:flagellar assembly protein FliW [Tepidibacillus fermentans]TCS83318.1 flagellar assembly factor FliW [Tepidibacillus fermentans]